MRVLITWGSKRGGTEGIARMIGDDLRGAGHEVVEVAAHGVGRLRAHNDFDAVVIGGALYANRWHHDARRFVRRNVAALRKVPVWFFSSGPLDDSALAGPIPPPTQVAVLMERVGALGHATFGGRLAPDAAGFPARAMAKEHAGDWRNREHVARWAADLARQLPTARPGTPVDHPARSPLRLVGYGVVGWALSALVLVGLLQVLGATWARVVHAAAAALIFVAIARAYFGGRGAREPLLGAIVFTGIVLVLDAVAFRWLTWWAGALVFAATWATGALLSTLPWPKAEEPAAPQARTEVPHAP